MRDAVALIIAQAIVAYEKLSLEDRHKAIGMSNQVVRFPVTIGVSAVSSISERNQNLRNLAKMFLTEDDWGS